MNRYLKRAKLRGAVPSILAAGGILTLLLTAVLCDPSYAGTASIVSSFRSPCRNAAGIDYHGGYIYHGDGRDYIYRTTTAGSVLDSYVVGGASSGIDRTDLEFWTCNRGGIIFRLSTSGSIIRTIEVPVYGYGITYGEGFLWYPDISRHIYKLTVNGSIVNSFLIPSVAQDVYWDAPYLWVNCQTKIYLITQTGFVLDSFPTVSTAYGVTRDGSYLWYSTTDNWVYKTQLNFTPVAPASLGQIKTLYR